ncbi:MAG TPA: XRE family transcriptional regulator [Acidisarcina sp.]
MAEALINGGMLRWARERRALDHSQLSKKTKISIEQLRQWEEEISFPPFSKAELLANVLKIPFGFLFLSNPPSDASPIPDFRTVDGKSFGNPSPDLLSVISQARTKQEWYREYSEGNGAPTLAFTGVLNMESGVDDVANAISEAVGINDQARLSVNSSAAFLKLLSEAAQEAGILVLRSGVVGRGNPSRLSVSEFRGFALADPYAPLVFINSRDAPAAQVFTLVHELAHIWINRTGIIDL